MEDIFKFGLFIYDMDSKKILSNQTGTFRVNCLDCLDRQFYFIKK